MSRAGEKFDKLVHHILMSPPTENCDRSIENENRVEIQSNEVDGPLLRAQKSSNDSANEEPLDSVACCDSTTNRSDEPHLEEESSEPPTYHTLQNLSTRDLDVNISDISENGDRVETGSLLRGEKSSNTNGGDKELLCSSTSGDTSTSETFNSDELFVCPRCRLGFRSKRNFKRHTSMVRPCVYVCPQCNKGFKSKKLLYVHINTHRINETRHICCVCKEAFKSKAELNSHIPIHGDPSPFVCPVSGCGKTFVMIGSPNNNEHIQTYNNAVICHVSECKKAFKEKHHNSR